MKHLILTTFVLMSASPALACDSISFGDLTIDHAWSRATIGVSRPAVLYVEISNTGRSDDALVGIATPVAETAMLHKTVVTDGIASMPHAMSIPLHAGQSVQLAPGGYHGMLLDLSEALKEGDSFPVKLTFQYSGEVTITVEVLPIRTEGPDCETAEQ